MKTLAIMHRMLRSGLLVLLVSIALAGCGGGSSSDSGVTGTATIQGSVPGSVFVAVNDETNLEAGRVTATGAGTPKSFSMGVPTGKRYRFYVMENEGTAHSRIYPLFLGSNNVFELDPTADGRILSLGMVRPDLATGRAIPENTPALMMARGDNPMVPASMAGSAFSLDLVKGTMWSYTTMMTSGTMGWEYGNLSFDYNGSGHMTGIVRNGNSLPPRNDLPFDMSLSGMLLNPGDNTFQCVVSGDMSVMVGTFTDNTGGPAMMIVQKRGGVFPTDGSDLTGTWRFQRLTAGSDNATSGWAHGTMQFTQGNASIITLATNAGLGGGGGNFVFSMDGNGLMTEATDASFHGVLSMDRNMIVATDTAEGHPELWILMKDTTGTFATSDMMGDWVMHAVSSGNPGSRHWTYGHSVVDTGGNDTFSGLMGSAGPVSSTQMTFRMNGGEMTISGMDGGMGGGMMPQTFHGILNEAKTLMVSTYTDGSGGYPFSIQVK